MEHIIFDGLSIDDTLDIIKEVNSYGAIVHSGKDGGFYDALNRGLAQVKGEIIAILNADDFYASPLVLSKVVRAMDENQVDSCYGDLEYVDADDVSRVTRRWRSGPYSQNRFYWGWMPPHPAFFVRRRIYETYGGFDTAFGTAADYELMLRLLVKHRVTTVYIPHVLVKMRTGGQSNASWRNRLRANRMDRLAWKANGLRPYPWTLMMKPLRKVGQFFICGK